MATHLSALLKDKLSASPYVGDIRQRGLMCGIELVKNRETLEAFDANLTIGRNVCLRARDHGVILRNLGDAIVIMPPLSITAPELKQIVDALAEAISIVATKIRS